MLADNAKKQRNMVMRIMVLKALFMIDVILVVVVDAFGSAVAADNPLS